MLVGVFKSNHKIINVLTYVLTIVLWLPAFFIDFEFSSPISTHIKWLDILIATFLIAGQAIYLNILVNEYKLIKENSHLASLILVLLNSCCILFLNLNQVVIANTFILIAFHQLMRMYNMSNSFTILFNSSLLIALASLIYFPSIIYFVLLWIALIYTVTPKWRDFIISLIGFSIPFIYYLTYQFIIGGLTVNIFGEVISLLPDLGWKDLSLYTRMLFITIAFVLIISFFGLLPILNRSIVRVRKMLIVTVIMLVLGLCTLFLNKLDYLATFITVTIPAAIIVANFFQSIKKKWLAELLFLVLLGEIVLSYFS